MNKNAIQKFAIWARNELIAQFSQRAYQYGIDESGFGDASADTLNGRLLTAEEKSQRQELIKQIKEKGYKQVMEEVSYTWFNRFIALRFMEVNNYLPSHIRVFSDASGAFKPEILNDVLHLDLPGLDSGKVAAYIESNDTEALYRYLLLTQCNALNSALPVMFERMGGYTEMLLPNNILRQDSVLGHMVSDIPEEDWQDAVQIIGWLYQYYNTELKDDTFAQLKKNVKITKERIPAATQLFTPDWIVRYMVENSLGRLWLEGHPNAELHDGWKYYLDEAEQEPEVEAQLSKLREEYKTIKPEEIKVIDPCMGSGHILVYAFDVLMQIYTSAGWDQREAAQSILKNNLYGLDIDDRAAQLAYFAVMMKARQYDRRLLTRGIQPNIYSIRESNGIQAMTIEYFYKNDPKLKADIERIVTEMRDAKEYGSILNITPVDFAGLYARFDEIRNDINMMQMSALDELLPLVNCAELLAQKYDVVVTNPPYMGSRKSMNPKLKKYVEKYYVDSKSDLYTVFIEKNMQLNISGRFLAMVTQQSFMFTDDYKELRSKLLANNHFINMMHLGADSFPEINGEVVQTTSFVLRSKVNVPAYKSLFLRLVDFPNESKIMNYRNSKYRYYCSGNRFKSIKANPFSYWLSDKMRESFSIGTPFEEYGNPRAGITTGDNDRFMRAWYEVNYRKIGFHYESVESFHASRNLYIPYNKGGKQVRWYGNNDYVLMFDEHNYNILSNQGNHLPSRQYYCLPCITWSDISGRSFAARYCDAGSIFDVKGSCGFPSEDRFWLSLAFLNSKLTPKYIESLNPTTTTQVGDLKRIPVIPPSPDIHDKIDLLAKKCVEHSRWLYDKNETSWDFKRNPLV